LSETTTLKIEIFVSYSHRDESHRQALETHLASLMRQDLISAWHDGKILPGAEWAEEIDRQLASSQIIPLLISPEFIASEFCYSRELKTAYASSPRLAAR
jgi:hypothetical protein